jgi:hypothetical protein
MVCIVTFGKIEILESCNSIVYVLISMAVCKHLKLYPASMNLINLELKLNTSVVKSMKY